MGSLLIPDLFSGKGDEAEADFIAGHPQLCAKGQKGDLPVSRMARHRSWNHFDYKPKLRQMMGQELPPSVRGNQILTGMTAKQASFPLVGSFYDFKQYGESRAWISDLFPHIGKIADDICIIRSMNTDAINHDPALTFFQTGAQQGNRPSMGSWVSYGLGSENKNLPAFTVLLSKGKGNGQGVYSKFGAMAF
jgi:hypothetical protein